MPDAQAYRSAAERCRAVGRLLADDAEAIRRSTAPDDVMSGPLADVMGSMLDGWWRELAVASQELAAVAMSCDRRAAVCEWYARSLAQYRSLPVWDRLVTAPPPRPAAWVDA